MKELAPSSYGKRVGAFLINMLIALGISRLSGFLALPEKLDGHLFYFIGLVYVVTFTLLPESPGKRILKMRTLDENKEPITVKRRFVRNSVYIAFFAITSLFYFLPPIDIQENKNAIWFIAPTHLIIPLFMLSNALTVLMQPQGLSLIDMRTKSQTYGMERNKAMLKAY